MLSSNHPNAMDIEDAGAATRSTGSPNSCEDHVTHILTFFRYLRIWPIDDTFSRCKLHLLNLGVFVLLAMNFFLVVLEIALAVSDFKSDQSTTVVSNLGLHLTGFFKWLYLITIKRRVVALVEDLNKCHSLCRRMCNDHLDYEAFRNEVRSSSRTSKLFLQIWVMFCIYGVFHWCATPLFLKFYLVDPNATNPLPHIAWQPWSIETNYGYITLYLVHLIGGMGSACGVASFDTFYVTVLITVCGQLRYLNISLNGEGRDVDTSLLKALEILASPTMFVQCVETMIVVCLLSFEASAVHVTADILSVMQVWCLFEYFMAAVTQLFAFCFCATQVGILSSEIANSTYSCSWESTTVRTMGTNGSVKHFLQMIILRAQKPVLLTGGPFYVLSVETFKGIISLALSNAVVLRQVSDSNKED